MKTYLASMTPEQRRRKLGMPAPTTTTPRPWRQDNEYEGSRVIRGGQAAPPWSGDDLACAVPLGGDRASQRLRARREANAALIVGAVNTFDDAREALRALLATDALRQRTVEDDGAAVAALTVLAAMDKVPG